jgi:hypothetical protein
MHAAYGISEIARPLAQEAELLHHTQPIHDLAVTGDLAVLKVVEGHPLNPNGAAGCGAAGHRSRLGPEHGPADSDAVTLGDGLAEFESKIRKRVRETVSRCLKASRVSVCPSQGSPGSL